MSYLCNVTSGWVIAWQCEVAVVMHTKEIREIMILPLCERERKGRFSAKAFYYHVLQIDDKYLLLSTSRETKKKL
ncbi:hypothetical protein BpHYR1_039578 [Brachionus plicatilis]|uniref:Uncharacterized protein n=1 Tax=Brachionus plicatilis TaxID=10195 RepID=A0A3M7P8Z1_BRAPC|nr:hypothetical protein BpHYR1_039578 [Brachionus plicatilis]